MGLPEENPLRIVGKSGKISSREDFMPHGNPYVSPACQLDNEKSILNMAELALCLSIFEFALSRQES